MQSWEAPKCYNQSCMDSSYGSSEVNMPGEMQTEKTSHEVSDGNKDLWSRHWSLALHSGREFDCNSLPVSHNAE